jgi:signal transduction histidine kinase
MKLRPKSNDRTRMIWTLELAVILPAAALVIISVLYLAHIQRDRAVEAAIQRDFSQVLTISEKQINQKAYALLDDARNQFPAPGEICAGSLDKVLAGHPYLIHAFSYDPQNGLIFRSQPGSLQDANVHSDAEYLSHMYEGWLKMDFDSASKKLAKMESMGDPYEFDAYWPARGDKHVYQSVAFFLRVDPRTGKSAISGAVFDDRFLHDKFFPEMLDAVISRNLAEGRSDKNPAVMMLHARSESTPLVASSEWDGGAPEVERPMEGAFPGLILAIKLRGTTLQAIGQRFVRTAFLILGGLSFLLAGGIFFTYRNVSKEMALAKLKSDFVSNVSHELRTPLSLIRLYAETLELGRLTSPEKKEEYYRIIRKESERLSALINNILDFSRIEAGRKEYDFRETDMRELVQNTLESYRFQIEQNGFTFEQRIEPDVPPMRVDREAIARSLLNLVNNAVKYSQDRKYLGVKLYRDNGSVKLQVVDHGIGIPQSEQHRIFEKFYRVGDPLVHNTKGSGLGLSLVRHIVTAHGGQVAVDSAPGRGSTFTISLPVAAAAKQALATQASS